MDADVIVVGAGLAGLVATAELADAVYLGTLCKQTSELRDTNWSETVPLRPLPLAFDDVPATLRFLERRAAEDSVALSLPLLGRPVIPWPGPRTE